MTAVDSSELIDMNTTLALKGKLAKGESKQCVSSSLVDRQGAGDRLTDHNLQDKLRECYVLSGYVASDYYRD